MLQPLEEYICDHCNKKISHPMYAEIVWNWVGGTDIYDALYSNYMLVHRDCGYHHMKEYHCNAGFDHFLDCFLLTPHAQDLNEYQELMRRLTVPYYEEARIYMQQHGIDAKGIATINQLLPNSKYYEGIVIMCGE